MRKLKNVDMLDVYRSLYRCSRPVLDSMALAMNFPLSEVVKWPRFRCIRELVNLLLLFNNDV